eukprot:TRINITY_DN16393_c0_g1_i1.p4 TRINITY_DN16393_c0_g1~~TRINITY_DN16393_c0_g1_i1.p4  ORF type:complete len:107 (-),score=13.69 TRINITY_DN16393_c0_g1_i1:47-367(-)
MGQRKSNERYGSNRHFSWGCENVAAGYHQCLSFFAVLYSDICEPLQAASNKQASAVVALHSHLAGRSSCVDWTAMCACAAAGCFFVVVYSLHAHKVEKSLYLLLDL